MCTVTIIPRPDGVRLACNRDEARTRLAALPPRIVSIDGRHALMPIDPQSGGTWIAVNDAGLILTLLNVNATPREGGRRIAPRSRGEIIPALASTSSLAEACEHLTQMRHAEFSPFRLVMADRETCEEFRFDGHACTRRTFDIDRPLLFTSSGLGDDLVDSARRALFDEMIPIKEGTHAQQDAFHRHSWPDRPHLSVCMSRPEARTVSFTIVEVDSDEVRMTYHADVPDSPSLPASEGHTLALRRPFVK